MRHRLLRDGILLRSILVTLVAFVLVGVATIAYTAYAARIKAENQSSVRLEQLLDTVESTLRVACFVKDTQLAREVALGLLSNTEILRVTIHESNYILADIQRPGSRSTTDTTGSLIRSIHSPFIEGDIIGRIRLTPDPDVIEDRIRDDIIDQALQLAWQLALIAGAIVLTLLAFVIHPISAMSRNLHAMDPTAGDRLEIPPGHAKTEIGNLVDDVNALAGSLVHALEKEQALRLRGEMDERRYHAIFDNAESGIFIVDRSGRLTSWNPAFARLLGIADNAAMRLNELPWTSPEEISDLIETAFDDRKPVSLDARLQPAGRPVFWLKLVLSPVGNDILQGVAHDVSALKEAEAAARRQALSDPLTGLANRASLEQQLGQRIRQHHQMPGHGFTLLHIDLDKFRLITEGVGVTAGDEILRAIANRLGATATSDDTLARLSADVFAILHPDLGEHGDIHALIEGITNSLHQPYLVEGSPIQLTASIGITIFPSDGSDAPSLLRNAELACDKAKQGGGNQAAFFDPTLAEAAEQRRHLENDLRHALTQQQFSLYYQPIADLDSRRVTGAEALIRWRHPERGLVPPDQFIPVVEQSGLINDIGLWVLDTACCQLAEWQAAGRPHYLSINVSGRQIPDGLPPQAVADAIARHGITPQRLALEITEGVLLGDIGVARTWLLAVQQLGVRLYLDDFGTGYSSLSYLKRFPLDTLKIDRSFVQDMQAENSDHSLVEAIVAMARSLRLRIVAEGVESAAQLQMLSAMGCHYAQGYHLSRPVPAADFAEVVREIDQRLSG